VVIALRVTVGPKFVLHAEFSDHVVLLPAAGGKLVAYALLVRAIFDRNGRIGYHHRVFPVLMLEVVKDPFLFHQSRDEIEISLTILHAIVAWGERAVQVQFEILETMLGKNLGDDIRDLLLLEDAAIRSTGEKPEPGDDFGVVVGEIVIA